MIRDRSFGSWLYRRIHGRDPAWDDHAADGTVGRGVYRRPVLLVEWARALLPLRIHFCRCGRLHEVLWVRGYIARHLYPKGSRFTVGVCRECFDMAAALSRPEGVRRRGGRDHE